ncbi:hypothetical protein PBY51_011072 [Eleginops maclovinus]|uniref:Uncharacterized protein n=1 Tax=Eleginops maclovinus TaxID=56733 RepID=A0AAN8AJW3_ELEMC|nr:hypothetical protein PBY51_011072 [Eleginops maclovinus]
MRNESFPLRAERNAIKKQNCELKIQIVYLKAQYQRNKPFHDTYNALKAGVEAQSEQQKVLLKDIDFFQKQIERKNILNGEFLRIKSEKNKLRFQNSLLRRDVEELFGKLKANQSRAGQDDFFTAGKDTAGPLRDDLKLKLRELQEIRERVRAMEEENDALLLAHAQQLCKERPKVGPWTPQIFNRGVKMAQRNWAYELC